MSYDIVFRVKVAGTDSVWVTVGEQYANITWNVGEMIRKSTRLEWKNEQDNGLVKDVIPHIQHGLDELVTRPEKYREYESPNGWGTIDGCIRFFERVISDWNNLRSYHPEFADCVHFWIV